MILPKKIEKELEIEKNRMIAELDKPVRQLENQRNKLQSLLRNAERNMGRFYVERDRLARERERLVREKATAEAWWLYICSFLPGKWPEFTRQRQRRDRLMTEIIGKQRTNEHNMDPLWKKIRSLKGEIQSIFSDEDEIEAKRSNALRVRAILYVAKRRRRA
jgi:hypothetical protein